jgi:hypothetical protein
LNAPLLQLRDGVKTHIAEDPSVIIPKRRALVADGFGGTSREGTLIPLSKVRVRLQHESGSTQPNSVKPSGLDTNLSMYALTDYRAPLCDGDEFDANGFTWIVGPVNEFRRNGGLYKTEAPLTKTTKVATS